MMKKTLCLLVLFFCLILNVLAQPTITRYYNNNQPVVEKSMDDTTAWNRLALADAEVVFYADTFRLWYTATGTKPEYKHPLIGYAWSLDGASWNKYGDEPVLAGTPGTWDSIAIETVTVIIDSSETPDKRFKMWYVGTNDTNTVLYKKMGYCYSADGINWTKHPDPVINAEAVGIDMIGFEGPDVVLKEDTFHMWYTQAGYVDEQYYWNSRINIMYAWSTDGVNWTKKTDEPVLKTSRSGWDSLYVQTPDVILVGDTFYMFYSGRTTDGSITGDAGWYYSVGCATSTDGINWNKYPEPIFTPDTSGSWDDASVGLVSTVLVDEVLHFYYTGHNACANDYYCFLVPPYPYYWDTGYGYDSVFFRRINVTVQNGTGGGVYRVGQKVSLIADTPLDGEVFNYWSGDNQYLDDSTAATATLTVPDKDIQLSANYKSIPSLIYVPSSSLKVFPNPADEFITVKVPAVNERWELSLVDVNGCCLFKQTAAKSKGITLTISLDEFPKGAYFVIFRSAGIFRDVQIIVH
jgi:hypothetical protein